MSLRDNKTDTYRSKYSNADEEVQRHNKSVFVTSGFKIPVRDTSRGDKILLKNSKITGRELSNTGIFSNDYDDAESIKIKQCGTTVHDFHKRHNLLAQTAEKKVRVRIQQTHRGAMNTSAESFRKNRHLVQTSLPADGKYMTATSGFRKLVMRNKKHLRSSVEPYRLPLKQTINHEDNLGSLGPRSRKQTRISQDRVRLKLSDTHSIHSLQQSMLQGQMKSK